MLPLSGLRILAVEQYGAGPFGTQYLADLGAEVIKIENPNSGGDYARYLGPYYVPGAEGDANSLFFQSCNRNKRSLSLDLSKPKGQEIFHQLVATAEVVCHNLRGDVPRKLGLRYADLQALNQQIICAHLTAYGRENERENWPGYDYLMQAESGYFSVTGEPGSPPARMGLSIVDFMTGLTMAFGILAGVVQARGCGTGRDIDVSLFDTALFNLNYLASWYLNAGHLQSREPRSAHPSLTPCALYKTADGWLFIMCNKEKFWSVLCQKIDRPEWINDPRFANFKTRLQHRDLITELLDEVLSQQTTAQWMSRFAGHVPATPLLDIGQALENSFVRDRDRVQTIQHQSGAVFQLLATPVQLDQESMPAQAAPELGQDTALLLEELGYQQQDQERLKQQRII